MIYNIIKVLIDNGHGIDTLGKLSPNGLLREYAWTREIAAMVVAELVKAGYDASLLTPEIQDISLEERVRRVDSWCDKLGAENVIVISIHANAAGSGATWMKAGGWCAFTSVGQTESDKLADCLYSMAAEYLKDYATRMEYLKAKGEYGKNQNPIRTDRSDGDQDIEEQFYILRKTKCAAVLTENLFMDNQEDYNYMLSEYGKQSIVNLHVDGIIKYCEMIYR